MSFISGFIWFLLYCAFLLFLVFIGFASAALIMWIYINTRRGGRKNMTMFILYIASVICFNYVGINLYKLKYKHISFTNFDFIMSLVPILNTIFAIGMAFDYYEELNRKD